MFTWKTNVILAYSWIAKTGSCWRLKLNWFKSTLFHWSLQCFLTKIEFYTTSIHALKIDYFFLKIMWWKYMRVKWALMVCDVCSDGSSTEKKLYFRCCANVMYHIVSILIKYMPMNSHFIVCYKVISCPLETSQIVILMAMAFAYFFCNLFYSRMVKSINLKFF